VGYDQPATVKLLLEHGANPSLPTSCGVTPLIEAAGRGHLPILQTLLGREGIAINAVRPGGEVTAFHFACAKGHADCAVELARRGCDMTLRTQSGATGKQLAEHGGAHGSA
jgi:ankyrin repeat protein